MAEEFCQAIHGAGRSDSAQSGVVPVLESNSYSVIQLETRKESRGVFPERLLSAMADNIELSSGGAGVGKEWRV